METVVRPDGEFVKFEEAMEASSNSLQQLKAEIASWVKRWDSASKDPCGLREFPSIDELRQLSAV